MIEPKPSILDPDAPRIENGRMVVDVPEPRGVLHDVSFAAGFVGALVGCATWAVAVRVYRAARVRAWERRQREAGHGEGPYRSGSVRVKEARGDGSIRAIEISVSSLAPPPGPSGVSRPPPPAPTSIPSNGRLID